MAYTTINKPEDYFLAKTYTGTGNAGNTISVGWKSDFLWLKSRTQTYPHYAFDTTRGGNAQLNPNSDAAESTNGDNVTFNTTSFVANTQAINEGGQGSDNMISWNWKANGGTTASNSDGSITSTVQANTTAGFSIVTWTGNGSDATIGHGLTQAPTIFIVKNRADSGTNWRVGQVLTSSNNMTDGNGYYMELDDTKASSNPGSAVTWGSTPTAPTSSVFTVGSNNSNNGSSDNMLAYCFHSVKGYSKFGNYAGNGNDDGPFIYTGFKPSFYLWKRTDSAGDWFIVDNKRDAFNETDAGLKPNSTEAESIGNGYNGVDFLSNGVKVRQSNSDINNSSGTYIYMAFAQNPLVATNDVIALAR